MGQQFTALQLDICAVKDFTGMYKLQGKTKNIFGQN